MKRIAVVKDLKDVFFKALNRLVNFISPDALIEGNARNQNATQSSPPLKDKANRVQPKKPKKVIQKDVYRYKGSGYKGKGNVNTDATIFNRPHKDLH